jgi:hypothetical protein
MIGFTLKAFGQTTMVHGHVHGLTAVSMMLVVVTGVRRLLPQLFLVVVVVVAELTQKLSLL